MIELYLALKNSPVLRAEHRRIDLGQPPNMVGFSAGVEKA